MPYVGETRAQHRYVELSLEEAGILRGLTDLGAEWIIAASGLLVHARMPHQG